MPSDSLLKTANTIHKAMLKLSGGRLGGRLAGMQVLELTTTGRRSGTPRSVMLTAPITVDGALVVVASRGGDDHHPAWFLNLQAKPDVTVALAGKRPQPMRARVANDDERAALWPKVVAAAKNYAGYQSKTTREIPLVLLEPRR